MDLANTKKNLGENFTPAFFTFQKTRVFVNIAIGSNLNI